MTLLLAMYCIFDSSSNSKSYITILALNTYYANSLPGFNVVIVNSLHIPLAQECFVSPFFAIQMKNALMMSHSDVVSLTHLAMVPQGGQSPHLMESHQYVLYLTISQKYNINVDLMTKSTHFMLALTRMVQL